MNLETDIKNLCLNVSQKLVKLPKEGDDTISNSCTSKLIFPLIRGKKLRRISEQEARFLFAVEIENLNPNIFYSVETPTDEAYSFGQELKDIKVDANGKSGMSDMSIFHKPKLDGITQKFNIEFKATNTDIKNIAKDILKLLIEEPDGVFFHVLEKSNKGTLVNDKGQKGVLTKYRDSIKELLINNPQLNFVKGNILFAICSIDPAYLVLKKVNKKLLVKSFQKFFDFNYNIKSDKNGSFNNWEFYKL